MLGRKFLPVLYCLLASCQAGWAARSASPFGSAPSRSGYLDVVVDCGGDPTGSSDSTVPIQTCLNRAYQYGGPASAPLWPVPVFFPPGVYVVSDTLNMTQTNPGPDDGINVCPTRFLSLAVFGSSAGPARPTLRLVASSPGFSSSSRYKPVVHLWQSQGGEGVDMNNVWKGVDVDLTQPGNPGAVAIQHAGAQGATVTDVSVRALPSTFACFAGLNGAGGEHSNIECYGARYGVYADDSQPVPVLVGATLVNQSVTAIAYLSQESLSLVAVRIVTSAAATGAAIVSYGGNRGISIVDSAVQCASSKQTAIATPSSLYARELFVRGCGTAIAQSGAAALPGPAPTDDGWLQVTEWAKGVDTGRYYFSDVIYHDGRRMANSSIRAVSSATVSSLPWDLQSRHVWNASQQAGVDTAGVANARTDCKAAGDDKTDDTLALQTCLDQHAAVFLPPGRYRISDTLDIRAGGSLVGMGSSFSFILASTLGFSTASEARPAPLLRTATSDAGGAPTVISFLGLLTWQHLAHVYTVDWRTQHPLSLYRSNFDTRECECLWTSAYVRLSPPDLSCQLPVNLTIPKAVFRGLGRVHSFVNDDTGHILSTSATYRAIRIADTAAFASASARLRFYSLNLEHAQSEANGELANATHVDIYSVKAEGNMPILWLRGDVQHVAILGLGGGFTAWPLNWTFPSDFTPATPSVFRVDEGARHVTLALLQDHGYGQSEYWPPTGGGCSWGHHYPFPGARVEQYPYWTYPNVTMWNCWYGVSVSNACWAMVWSPQHHHTQPGDKPVLWRLGGDADKQRLAVVAE